MTLFSPEKYPAENLSWAVLSAVVVLVLMAAGVILVAPREEKSAARVLAAENHFASLPVHDNPLTVAFFHPEAQPARFIAHGRRIAASLTAGQIDLKISAPRHSEATIRMRLAGANRVEPGGMQTLPGRTHLLIGNDPSRWQRNLVQFAKVRYRGVYEGIDLVLYGNPDELEYDFLIARGSDPAAIRLVFEGAQRVLLDGGDLVLETAAGIIRHRRPQAYQTIHGVRRSVAVSFQIDSASTVSFRLGDYDRAHPLVIDPVLAYGTYLGGSSTDLGQAIAVDSQGYVYLAGQASSIDFPRTPGSVPGSNPRENDSLAFVTKLDPTGSRIIYSTLLGGSDYDIANGLAVGSDGSAYIVGETKSDNFPATSGALQRNKAGDRDAFIAKLSPDGASLMYASFLGGDEIDIGTAVAVDAAGSAFITGVTYSEDFPTTEGAYGRRYAAERDVFVAKLTADGSRLLYSTLIAGSGIDLSNAIAIDASGNAYFAGLTDARRANGVADAYCAKLDPQGAKLLYIKLFGGAGLEEATAVAIDAAGNAYLTGSTYSKDFPATPGALQTQSKSPVFMIGSPVGYDAFVAKIDSRGENLLASTYLNGTWSSRGQAIAVAADGTILVAGYTHSPDFPITADALPPPPNDNQFKGFFAQLNATAGELLYSTRFGGSSSDQGWGLALDPAGDAYVTGFSVSPDLPTSEGVVQPRNRGAFDAFLLKFSSAEPPVVAASGIVSGASFLGGAIAPGMMVSIFGSGLGPPDAASLQIDGNGRVKTQLNGVRVLFNDVPAPVIFASPTQLGAIAPYALDSSATIRVVVESQGLRSVPVDLTAAPSAPGLFTLDASGAGGGAILNQDGSVNTAANPAGRGSIVVLFGTGEGQTEPGGEDGRIITDVLPRPRLPVSVTIGGQPAEVVYAGGAPGLVAGVLQVNARVPADLTPTGNVPVVLEVGSAASQPGVTLAVR
jgi:uncharacterized protein (TIGR03437 family)